MVEALNGPYALHPDIRGLVAENGQKAELGDKVVNALREEYLRQGFSLSDKQKIKFIAESLAFEATELSALVGEENLKLHDNFLAVSYLRVHGPTSKPRFQDWINTSWAALEHKSPKDLILSGDINTIVGSVYEAYNWELTA